MKNCRLLFIVCSLVLVVTTFSGLGESLDFWRGPAGKNLRLAGEANATYSLEATTNLASGQWETYSTFFSTNQTSQWQLNDPALLQFFRIQKHATEITPRTAQNFRLNDHKGFSTELWRGRTNDLVLLVFGDFADLRDTGALAYLSQLKTNNGTGSTAVWVVDSSTNTSRTNISSFLESNKFNLIVYSDPAGIVAGIYHATRSGEIFVIEMEPFQILFHGLLSPAGKPALEMSLQQYKSQVRITTFSLLGTGKPLIRLAPSHISYSQQIAPILTRHCVRCHSVGNIGPFAMTNHAVIKNYAASMRIQLLDGHMPPWHVDPEYQRFSNDGALPDESKAMLVQWIEEGALKDGTTDPLTTNQVAAVDWPLGKPDYIIKLQKQFLPANGTIAYRNILTNSPFSSNVWLRAAVVKPGNRQVLHHCLVLTGFDRFLGGITGFFAGYVPGVEQGFFPENTAKFLATGTVLQCQMHYTANGTATSDETELGFYLASQPPLHELKTGSAFNTEFTIPPNQPDVFTETEITIPKKIRIYEVSPHMHHRGSRFRYEAIYPDGSKEVLLSVPHYEFSWQSLYRFETPKELPAGTKLRCVGAFDNSPHNPHNPDPNATVRFGEQSWDEMFIGYFNYVELQ